MGTKIKEFHEGIFHHDSYQCIFPTTTRQEQIPIKLSNLRIGANLELVKN
jgi:hypothetical protein